MTEAGSEQFAPETAAPAAMPPAERHAAPEAVSAEAREPQPHAPVPERAPAVAIEAAAQPEVRIPPVVEQVAAAPVVREPVVAAPAPDLKSAGLVQIETNPGKAATAPSMPEETRESAPRRRTRPREVYSAETSEPLVQIETRSAD